MTQNSKDWKRKTVYLVLTLTKDQYLKYDRDSFKQAVKKKCSRFAQHATRHNWSFRMRCYFSDKDGKTGLPKRLHAHVKFTSLPGQTGIDLFRRWWESEFGIAKIMSEDNVYDDWGLLKYFENQSYAKFFRSAEGKKNGKRAQAPKYRHSEAFLLQADALKDATSDDQSRAEDTWFLLVEGLSNSEYTNHLSLSQSIIGDGDVNQSPSLVPDHNELDSLFAPHYLVYEADGNEFNECTANLPIKDELFDLACSLGSDYGIDWGW
jgi:hypothetical protein